MQLVGPHSLQLSWTFVMLPSNESTNEIKCFWLCCVVYDMAHDLTLLVCKTGISVFHVQKCKYHKNA